MPLFDYGDMIWGVKNDTLIKSSFYFWAEGSALSSSPPLPPPLNLFQYQKKLYETEWAVEKKTFVHFRVATQCPPFPNMAVTEPTHFPCKATTHIEQFNLPYKAF